MDFSFSADFSYLELLLAVQWRRSRKRWQRVQREGRLVTRREFFFSSSPPEQYRQENQSDLSKCCQDLRQFGGSWKIFWSFSIGESPIVEGKSLTKDSPGSQFDCKFCSSRRWRYHSGLVQYTRWCTVEPADYQCRDEIDLKDRGRMKRLVFRGSTNLKMWSVCCHGCSSRQETCSSGGLTDSRWNRNISFCILRRKP